MIDAFFARLAVSFDLPILDWIQANLKSGVLDLIMPIITLLGDAGIFWIACAVVLLCIPKYRKAGLGMGIALLMGLLVCNIAMKPLFHRIRPYDYKEQYLDTLIPLLVERQHDFSFPSGHTIASFEACSALMLRNKRLGIPATLLAILIAFSRMYLYVHYPTDVIASVILGTAFGFLATWIVDRLWDKFSSRKGKFQA